ncbi:MAG: flagellar hook-length control protein FliK, partial [Betaproteobacteria bacterium]|nr:flagellar hook-length control protein FliK [Betaproteobacteria bacterium]
DPGGAIAQRQTGNLPFLAKLELGQHLQATVQARLSSGEFAVMLHSQDRGALDGLAWHMKLPARAQPGDIFNLVFVAREPRPEFTLTSGIPRDTGSPLLSGTGRFINDLLRRPVFPDDPATVARSAPLLGAPPGDGVELSLRLAQALGRSGLFYESHQAQWISGTKPFSELLMEPQAQLAGSGSRSRNADTANTNARAAEDPAVRNTPPVRDFIYSDRAHPDPVHPDALALVRQQLDVVETRHIVWQGEAWPGQAFALEAFEEEWREGEGGSSDGGCAVPWQTRLRLTLPNLGRVTANLRLHRYGLEVSLTAPDQAATTLLQSGVVSLAQRLEGAGIRLLGMGVNIDEESD